MDRALETYAVLDDGSERSIILPHAVKQLNLCGRPETLHLQTIQQNVEQLQGSSVSFDLSPMDRPSQKYRIHQAFTAGGLNLAEHSYPVAALQQRYKHLKGLPLQPIDHVHPMLLIGSDMPHLLVPIKPVRAGPPGGPIGVCTQLGWSLQGPTTLAQPTVYQPCSVFASLLFPLLLSSSRTSSASGRLTRSLMVTRRQSPAPNKNSKP